MHSQGAVSIKGIPSPVLCKGFAIILAIASVFFIVMFKLDFRWSGKFMHLAFVKALSSDKLTIKSARGTLVSEMVIMDI